MMKGIPEISKFVWLINSFLITILVYIMFGFISDNYVEKDTFACPIPIKEKLEIIPVKRPLLPIEHKTIIERNIFDSSGLSHSKEDLQRKNNDTLHSLIKGQFRLCATVAGDNQIACAVVEDLKSRRQDIYKAGEIVGEARIEEIGRNKILLFYGGQLDVLNLHIAREVLSPVEKDEEPVMARKHDTTEPFDDILPIKREINDATFDAHVPAIEVFLEKVEVAPYIMDGQEKGLCITSLDDLSLTRYFGFENGDVIQNVNGQVLTSKQKAFQVIKKARSQSAISVQLLRDQRMLDLSFEIK